MKYVNLLATTALAVLAASPAFAAQTEMAEQSWLWWMFGTPAAICTGYVIYALATGSWRATPQSSAEAEAEKKKPRDSGAASSCGGADPIVIAGVSGHTNAGHATSDGGHATSGGGHGTSDGGSAGGGSDGGGSSCGGSSCGGGGGCGGGGD
jgi:hypothetical protein